MHPLFRPVTPRIWTSLALVGSAGLSVATPLAADGLHHLDGPETVWLAQAEGGEGGEAGAVAAAPEDAGYLASLGFIQGHLRVGLALYEEDRGDMAITHMKHPQDEIYADLAPLLAARGADGFDEELSALALAVEGGATVTEAQAAFADVVTEISEAREGFAPRLQLDALVIMLRTAADEFSVGIVDGQVAELHEYQDAWGFVQVARDWSAELAQSDDPTVTAAAAKVLEALADADTAFSTLAPEGAVTGTADILYGTAARVELAALSVK
jgi:hypothetical protein